MAIDQGTGAASGTGSYANVNGINLYYETHGTGKPLILLAIIPDETHYSVFLSPVLVAAATAFLDRPAA